MEDCHFVLSALSYVTLRLVGQLLLAPRPPPLTLGEGALPRPEGWGEEVLPYLWDLDETLMST